MLGFGLVIAGPVATVDGGSTTETTEQDDGNVEIDSAVAESNNETTVLVWLEDRPEREAATTASENQVASMQSHANETQAAFERFADGNPHVEIERQFWITNAMEVTVDLDEIPIERIANVDNVVRLEPDTKVEADVATPAPSNGSTADTDVESTTSNSYTYGLETIRAPEVWDQFDTRGDGVSVAVLDSGVEEDHPDIDVAEWRDFDSSPSREPKDYGDHGTHVSGTVIGGNASGTHIGVAPDADLMHGAVLTDCDSSGCYGWQSDIIDGIQWAVDNDADVVSMSLGSEGYSSDYIHPVRNAERAGTIVVASIGNDGEGTSGSPGNVYDSFAVGASNDWDSVASFSSGEEINTDDAWGWRAPSYWPSTYAVPDVVAPGTNVKSSVPGDDWEDDWHGTSMATPHVSGSIALLLSSTDDDPSPTTIENVFESTAVDIGDEQHRQGSGRIDTYDAVLEHSRNTMDPTIEPGQVNVSKSTTFTVEVDHPIESYEWAIDDDELPETGNETGTHEFDELGTVDVQVTMEDIGGESFEHSTEIEVVDEIPPTAELEANRTEDVEVGLEPVTLDASESTDNHEIDRYEWAVGDEHIETTNESTLEHTFAEPGNQTVSVTVVDKSGNENETTTAVDVVDTTEPIVDLEAPDEAIVGANTTYDASESTDNHEIERYEWSFGDGTEANTTEPVTAHVFNETGEYTANLTVVDPSGNVNATETTTTVRDPPTVSVESPADGTATNESNVTVEYVLENTDLGNATTLEYRVDDTDGADEPVVDWAEGPFETTANETDPFAIHTGELEDGNYTVSLRLIDGDGEIVPFDSATEAIDHEVKTTKPTLEFDARPDDTSYSKIGTDNPAVANATTTDHRHASTTVTVVNEPGDVVDEWDVSTDTGNGETATISWNGTDADGEPVPSGDYTIEASATDDAGNTETATDSVVVDTDEPGTEIEWIDGERTHDGIVYANDSTDIDVAVTAHDGSSEERAVANVSVDLVSTATTYRHAATVTQDDEKRWTATANASELPDEGEYLVRATATDSAKNQHTETGDGPIAYVPSEPTLGVDVTAFDDTNETATVSVHSDAPLVDDPTVTLVDPDGTVHSVDDIDPVDGTDDHWTGTFTGASTGAYELTAAGTDRAGNRGIATANATIDTVSASENETVTVYDEQSDTFASIETTEAVDDAAVTLSETDVAPHDLAANRVGVSFLTLGTDLGDSVENVTVGFAADEERLPGGIAVDDDRIDLAWYNETTQQWEDRNLTVQDLERDVGNETIAGEYWTATAENSSAYGVTVEDTEPPELVDVTPADGDTVDSDTETVTVELEYADVFSGVDPSSIEFHVDGENVTDHDRTQLTADRAVHDDLPVESNETVDVVLELADEADNEARFETTFDVASDDDSGGGGGGLGGLTDDQDDQPQPTAEIDLEPDPADVGEPITFDASDSSADRMITDYVWTIDGETYEGETVTTAFDEPGTYEVELVVSTTMADSEPETATVSVDDVTDDEESPSDDSDDSEREPAAGIPGFGIVVGIIALGSVVALLVRRQTR